MSFEAWLEELGDWLNLEAAEVIEFYGHLHLKERLYDVRASPSEAADFIRTYG